MNKQKTSIHFYAKFPKFVSQTEYFMSKQKVILCIMDGYGIREETVYGNAIKCAHTPNLDYLRREYPNILLEYPCSPFLYVSVIFSF